MSWGSVGTRPRYTDARSALVIWKLLARSWRDDFPSRTLYQNRPLDEVVLDASEPQSVEAVLPVELQHESSKHWTVGVTGMENVSSRDAVPGKSVHIIRSN